MPTSVRRTTRKNLTQEELDFVARPLLGKFASINKDGSPHLTPVWQMYENGKFIVTTPDSSVKARNVRRDHRVALLVDDGEVYVMIRGNGSITEGKGAEFHTERLARRYEDDANATRKAVELLREKHVMIEVTPQKIVSQGV